MTPESSNQITRLLLRFLFCLLLSLAAHADNDQADTARLIEDKPGSHIPDRQTIQQKLEQIKNNAELSELNKTSISGLYETVLSQLELINNSRIKRHAALQFKNTIDQELEQLNSAIQELNTGKPIPPSTQSNTIKDLEEQLLETETKILEAKNNLQTLLQERQTINHKPFQLREEQHDLQQTLESVEEKLQQLNPSTFSLYLQFEAQQLTLMTKKLAVKQQLEFINDELANQPAYIELIRKRFEYTVSEIAQYENRQKTLKSMISELRDSQFNQFSQTFAENYSKISNLHPVIVETFRLNLDLNSEYKTITNSIDRINKVNNELDLELSNIRDNSEKAHKILNLSALSPNLAAFLRDQRVALRDSQNRINQSMLNLADRQKAGLRLFEIQNQLKNLQDIDNYAASKLSFHTIQSAKKHELMTSRVELKLLLNEQKKLFEELDQSYAHYIRALDSFDFTNQQLVAIRQDYLNYLDKNLLWVKSTEPISLSLFPELNSAINWLFSTTQWQSVWRSLIHSARTHVLEAAGVCSLLLFLLLLKPLINKQSEVINQKVCHSNSDRFSLTMENFLMLILRIAPVIVAVYFVSWLLRVNKGAGNFELALSESLESLCKPIFFLQFFYLFFAEGCMADKHLRWPTKSIRIVRNQLYWLRYLAVFCLFLIAMTNNTNTLNYNASLGRSALILLLTGMFFALYKVTHPEQGAISRFIRNQSPGLLYQTRFIWFSLVILIPVVIAGFAVAGYLASALELQQRTVSTIRLVVIAIIIHALALRALRLFNRNLGIRKFLEKKKAQGEAQPAGESGEVSVPTDLNSVDISAINQQTRRLLILAVVMFFVSGIWLIWKDLLPALAITNDYVLWTKQSLVGDTTVSQSITLANLLISIAYLIIGFFAVRNLPGLLEVIFLNRISLEPGTRYATIQLVNYALTALILFLVFRELGAEWSQVQWLVAALGVGLGFGLQEIFANMVSGLILLFERPIRIGDTVTVGDITGTVSKIQIRATTITDWDKKELLVPNKNFITDQLVNWTLSDNTTRVIIKIGVAYDTDTELVQQTLMEIITEHSLILKDPPPVVLFTEFGDSALNFEIRIFVTSVVNRLTVTHDLHSAIDRKFKELNIVIPFPQRDVHVFKPATGS